MDPLFTLLIALSSMFRKTVMFFKHSTKFAHKINFLQFNLFKKMLNILYLLLLNKYLNSNIIN